VLSHQHFTDDASFSHNNTLLMKPQLHTAASRDSFLSNQVLSLYELTHYTTIQANSLTTPPFKNLRTHSLHHHSRTYVLSLDTHF